MVGRRTFGRCLDFACLTGSAADRYDPDADIDVIAVLKTTTPVNEAVRMRLHFSAEYSWLHRRFTRRPDFEWPGEVTYSSDLEVALAGAAFQRNRTGVSSQLRWTRRGGIGSAWSPRGPRSRVTTGTLRWRRTAPRRSCGSS
ncbi:hypothetical protein Q0Z83_054120 [Actinoplanes sichuanensis]|nr:hypothetical protein Q0Z83_054120 [Actinoplanes sichuanensis]